MDFVRERREWEARRAREIEMEDSMGMGMQDVEDVDALVERLGCENGNGLGEREAEMSPTEDKELEELLSYMPDTGSGSRRQWDHVAQTVDEEVPDDEDYDHLFMEIELGSGGFHQNDQGGTTLRRTSQLGQAANSGHGEAMDMS